MRLNTMTLVKIASVGGILTVSMGMAARNKLNNQIKDSEYYREAMRVLRTNRGAVHLLGEPIRDGTINVGDTTANRTDHKTYAQYTVPVRGTKQKGTLYLSVAAASNERQWILTGLELSLENEPDRRLLLIKSQ